MQPLPAVRADLRLSSPPGRESPAREDQGRLAGEGVGYPGFLPELHGCALHEHLSDGRPVPRGSGRDGPRAERRLHRLLHVRERLPGRRRYPGSGGRHGVQMRPLRGGTPVRRLLSRQGAAADGCGSRFPQKDADALPASLVSTDENRAEENRAEEGFGKETAGTEEVDRWGYSRAGMRENCFTWI